MPRVANNRPTSIYWLFDTRPETLEKFPGGKPFYCGKTVEDLRTRFQNHRTTQRKHPNRPVSIWLTICGECVDIRVVDVVPPGEDWCERERVWICSLRSAFPDCANMTDGGQGAPGNVMSDAVKAKIRATKIGKPRSPETIAKMVASRRGKKISVSRSPEYRAQISARRLGKKHSPETRAKMSAAKKGKPGFNRGKTFSEQARANMSAAAIKRCQRFGPPCRKQDAA